MGKSTLVNTLLSGLRLLTIDLLNPDEYERLVRHPEHLKAEVLAGKRDIDWVFIDEVQKVPKLLDVVHSLIEGAETRHIKFALTGSSARKLKLAGANLLAGRAFSNELYPLSSDELRERFSLDEALNWGTLPKIFQLEGDDSRKEFLRTYGRTYLKEEVWDERLVHSPPLSCTPPILYPPYLVPPPILYTLDFRRLPSDMPRYFPPEFIQILADVSELIGIVTPQVSAPYKNAINLPTHSYPSYQLHLVALQPDTTHIE